MPLVTSKELFARAMKERYAIGAFNANNMEMVQAIVEAAEEERSPVILQVSQGAIKYAGLAFATEIAKIAANQATIPVVLHLDHGTDFEQNVACFRAGFTSLMFDGSSRPFAENIAITHKVCEIAHIGGVVVEGELGKIGGTEDHITVSALDATMTDPDEALEFVQKSGVDSLAVAVGTVHRMRTKDAKLDYERIKKIRDLLGIPLVLHGASGVSDESSREAIACGICKINVATELNGAFVRGMKDGIVAMPDEVDPRKILKLAKKNVKEVVRERIRVFGSAGKA
jgi:fructose-bisphosphate aldolase, class II